MQTFRAVSRDVDPYVFLTQLSQLAKVPLIGHRFEHKREFVRQVVALLQPESQAHQPICAIMEPPNRLFEIIFGPQLRESRPPIWIDSPDLRYPANLTSEKSSKISCPAFRRLVLNNGAVGKFSRFGPLIFDKDRLLVSSVSTPYAPFVQYYDWDLTQEVKHWRKVAGPAIVLMDCLWYDNYCHWFLDNLVRLCAVDRARPYTVICNEIHYNWQRELLQLAGVPEERIVALKDFDGVVAEELIVPDNVAHIRHPVLNCHPQAFKFLQSLIEPVLGPAPCADKSADVTLITRRESGTRCLVDEPSLCNLLADKNISYEIVELEDLTVVEQLQLFWRSSSVVAVHGAGLTNSIAMTSGASVFELVPPNHFFPAFYMTAVANNLSYFSVTGLEAVGEGQRPAAQNIALGPEKAEVLVNHLLNI